MGSNSSMVDSNTPAGGWVLFIFRSNSSMVDSNEPSGTSQKMQQVVKFLYGR